VINVIIIIIIIIIKHSSFKVSLAQPRKLNIRYKGTVHPRTGREGLEGKFKFSSTLSITSALDGGGRSAPPPRRFTPGKDPIPTAICDISSCNMYRPTSARVTAFV